MLKKILSTLLIFLFLGNIVLAYNPTQNDTKLLNSLYLKIDWYSQSKQKLEKIKNNIYKIRLKYRKDWKVNYTLTKLIEYIDYKLNNKTNTPTDSSFLNDFSNYDNSNNYQNTNNYPNNNSNSNNSSTNTNNSNTPNITNTNNWTTNSNVTSPSDSTNINNSTTNSNTNNTSNSALCSQNLGQITANYQKETVNVSTFDGLYNAVLQAKTRTSTDKWYEIVIASWNYNITKNLWITAEKVIFRWQSGKASDVVLHWQAMTSGMSHGFMVAGKNIMIWDLTIQNVKNHAIQVHWEKDADNFFVHNVNFFDTWEQMLKWSFDSNTWIWADNWIVQCSHFEYKAWIGPQYYIGWIDVHNGKNWTVRNNTFKSIISPDTSVAEHAVHFWSNSENTLVENNLIINCDRWVGFWLGNSKHTWWIIRNNIIYHNSSKWDVWIGLESVVWAKVLNNTIFLENTYNNTIEYRFTVTNVTIENNLTNKLIKQRDSWNATLNNNVTNATISMFKNIGQYDFRLINWYNWIWANQDTFDANTNPINQNTNPTSNNPTNPVNTNPVNPPIVTNPIAMDTFEKNWSTLRQIYVDKNISTTWDWTKSKPFKTFKEAYTKAIPWDEIIIASWTYEWSNYITNFQWTSANPIKVTGIWQVIIEGWNTWIQFVKPSYLVVRNITISGSRDNWMNIDDWWNYSAPAHHILIDNVTIKNIGNGGNQDNLKLSWIDNFYIINSNFRDWSSGGSWIDMVGCHNWIIKNNNFYNLWNNFVQAKWGSSDVEISNNFCKKVLQRWINMWGSTWAQYFRPTIASWVNYEAKNIVVKGNTFIDTDSAVAFVGCVNCKATENIIYKPRTWVFRILQETTTLDWKTFLLSSYWEFSKNKILFNSSIRRFVNIGPNTDSTSFKFEWNTWYNLDNPNFNYSQEIASLPVQEVNPIKQINPNVNTAWFEN